MLLIAKRMFIWEFVKTYIKQMNLLWAHVCIWEWRKGKHFFTDKIIRSLGLDHIIIKKKKKKILINEKLLLQIKPPSYRNIKQQAHCS